jgi:hypothetical protein
MKQSISALLVTLIFSLSMSGQIATGGAFSLEKSATATGGGTSLNGVFSLTGTSGQNAGGTNTSNMLFDQIGGFWTPDQFQTTAALVSIGGKVSTRNGNGIRNAFVILTDLNGSSRAVYTGSFGRYRFSNVEVGQTYTLNVISKRYIFATPTQVVLVMDELRDLDFISEAVW